MRGTLHPVLLGAGGDRYTPAYAGNSGDAVGLFRLTAVHPRVCGELSMSRSANIAQKGTPPRMRGTLLGLIVEPAPDRYTPAYAGNSPAARSGCASAAVHPRVCGELQRCRSSSLPCCGTPPRMRGTHDELAPVGEVVRYTPAYAGNSGPPPGPSCGRPVHPRVCGELFFRSTAIASACGTPPRMRGTLRPRGQSYGRHRYTPAYAGNSHLEHRYSRSCSVHPRVCGELHSSGSTAAGSGGTPPRMRGTPEAADVRGYAQRYTPAYAGNSSPTSPADRC